MSTASDVLVASDRARDVGRAATRRHLTIGVAESLTGGLVASTLAAAPGAGEWFRGAIVAYAADVKHDVLGTGDHPVVSRGMAEAMAEGAADRLDADVTVALTGVGGPDEECGVPPGTVWIAVHRRPDLTRATLEQFAGDPKEVCDASVLRALELLLEVLDAPMTS